MSKDKISDYSATANSNTDIGGINIDEGCAPSGINDAIRELMAQLKDFQTGAQGDSFNGPVGGVTPAAGTFTTVIATALSGPHTGTVGATTPSTGAFTTLTANSTLTLTAATGTHSISSTTASTTTTTGAFTVAGGVGIAGQLNVGGATNKFTASTNSTSTTSGALVVTGGVGIGQTMYIGDDIVGSGAGTLASPGSVIDGFMIDGGTY